MIGEVLGNYRIVTELGSGGMGTVYYGEHSMIGRRAAIKVLNAEVSSNQDIVSRFLSEARAANNIRHPNIVDITDFGHERKIHFLVMELLEGETLGARLERVRTIHENSGARILMQVAAGVGAAHDVGIVHRDLKPENIFLTNHKDYPDHVKVLDFGIAKLVAHQWQASHRTATGIVMGTPWYMSPEQCTGDQNLDHRSDIYSLGCVAYEMLAGRVPFESESMGKLIIMQVQDIPKPPREVNPKLGKKMNDVILKAMEKNPDNRFQSMQELRDALDVATKPSRPMRASKEPSRMPPKLPAPPPPAAPKFTAQEQSRTVAKPATREAPKPPKPATIEKNAESQVFARQVAVEKAQTKEVSTKLKEIVKQRIENDRLKLPSMPLTVMQCLQKIRDPRTRLADVAVMMEKDPLLAPRILRYANSAIYASLGRVTTLDQAVRRLGVKNLEVELVEMSAAQVFTSRDPGIQEDFKCIWEHCLGVAMIARDLTAKLKSGLDKDVAYLAGLLHDVGKPVVGALLLETERSLLQELGAPWLSRSLWQKVVGDSHREVGAALAKKWMLPEPVCEAIENGNDYDAFGGATSCSNIVRFANLLAKREHIYMGEFDEREVHDALEAGRAIIGTTLDLEEEVLYEIRDRIQELTGAELHLPEKPTKQTRAPRSIAAGRRTRRPRNTH